MAKPILSQEYLKQLFDYKDGHLYWKVAKSKNTIIDSKTGSTDKYGYLRTSIDGKSYKTHRLIFLYHHGYLPYRVDHADNNPKNNQINNLRQATVSQNQYNQKLRSDNKSGCKGVYWISREKKWAVSLYVAKEKKNLGYFDDLELACLVAQEARDKYHGEYARHN